MPQVPEVIKPQHDVGVQSVSPVSLLSEQCLVKDRNGQGMQIERLGKDYLSLSNLSRRQFLDASLRGASMLLVGGSLSVVSSVFSTAKALGWAFVGRALLGLLRSIVVSVVSDAALALITNNSYASASRSYKHLSAQGFSTPLVNDVYELPNQSSAVVLQHDEEPDASVVFQIEEQTVALSGPVAAAFVACGEVWPAFVNQQQGLNIALTDALLPVVSPVGMHIGGSFHKSFAQPMHYATKLGSVSVDYAAPSARQAHGLVEVHVVVAGQEVFWDRYEIHF